jgi:hypothetical protein
VTASVSWPVVAKGSDLNTPTIAVVESDAPSAIRGPINIDVRFQAAKSASVDLDTLRLLLPELQMKVGLLALDANTNKLDLAYSPGNFTTSLSYNYRGNAQAALSIGSFSMRVDVDTATGSVDSVDLGLVYRGLYFGASADPAQKSADVGISYGKGLLPFTQEPSSTVTGANGGPQSMSRAIQLARQLSHESKNPTRFGAGLRLHYSAQTKLMIYAGVRLDCL